MRLRVAAIIAALTLASGCDATSSPVDSSRQSLVEIGEHALEEAERLELDGRLADANQAYRKALWAFSYHQHLTREEPLLADEAEAGVRRTGTGM